MTVHNFPEGLAVGVGFGALGNSPAASAAAATAAATPTERFNEAWSLAFGIGLQNIPEGTIRALRWRLPLSALASASPTLPPPFPLFPPRTAGIAVALPLARLGVSPLKAFFMGQLSGMVELFAGAIGAVAVRLAESTLPFAMALAAGAMIYVVVEQLVPEAHADDDDEAAAEAAEAAEAAAAEAAEAAAGGRGGGGLRGPPTQCGVCALLGRVKAGTVCSVGVVIGFVVMMVMDVVI